MSPILLRFIFGIIVIKAQQEMLLHLFPEKEEGGQCLDSSAAGFYYSKPPSGSSNLWVIYLEGGGACSDEASCMFRANSSLGSSNYWSKTLNSNIPTLNSNNPSRNPDFYTAHQVYGPYCSGDGWSGQRSTPSTDPDTWGLYFSGHLIFQRIIQYLAYNLSSASILDAQFILLTGSSAGGVGVFGNINSFYNTMKTLGKYKDNITIKANPDAGWFYPGNTTDQLSDPMMPPNDYPHWILGKNGGVGHQPSNLWDSYLDPTCVSALGAQNAWHCGSVHNGFPFINKSIPIFVTENKFDSNQIEQEMLMPSNVVTNETINYVEYYGIDMDRSIITQLVDEQNGQNGLFYPSCFNHGGFGSTKINGHNSNEVMGDWFWERNKLPHIVYDTCNDDKNQLPCNPTCNPYPPTN